MTAQMEPISAAILRDLSRPEFYTNRELSLLDFHHRVLEQASERRYPLLERVKFLAIFNQLVDDFFMIRVSGLKEQLEAGIAKPTADGLTPQQQLDDIRALVVGLYRRERQLLNDELSPGLAVADVKILSLAEVKPRMRAFLDDYFAREIFPILTPLAVDPGHPFPHISNLSLNLAVVVRDEVGEEHFARLKVPDTLPRLLPTDGLKLTSKDTTRRRAHSFVWLEELIAANLSSLFSGMSVAASYPFRVIRDADLEIQEDEAADLAETIEQGLRLRRFGEAVRLSIDTTMPDRVRHLLMTNLKLGPNDVYSERGPLGLDHLMELTRIDRPDLKFPSFVPRMPAVLRSGEDIFGVLRQKDILLQHPYDSFAPVVEFLQAAARDPDVLGIKQTLYRVGQHSPVVDALLDASQRGKQVAVLVELKARGDEEDNLEWARELERAGVHVAYGLVGLKTHTKVALVVRREVDGIQRYLHLGTGNYNATTARLYTDYALMTSREDLAADASDLFNYLTGYSSQNQYRSMLVAPIDMRAPLSKRIQREVRRHRKSGDGHIAFKVNSLTDEQVIRELYRAAQVGVKIDLLVRGACGLRPGVRGLSDTITVRSIVGRFLEHSRVYWFNNAGDCEALLGSADLMERNLDRRVEILFPVEDASAKERLRQDLLEVLWRDNVNAWQLQPDATWVRIQPAGDSVPLDSQSWFLAPPS